MSPERPHRVAIYFAPEADDPLWRAGCAWLGRDPERDAALPQPPIEGLPPARLAAITADARRYGFHATIKAPFRLAEGRTADELAGSVAEIARAIPAFDAPPAAPASHYGYVTVLLTEASAEMAALEQRVVMGLEAFRAPLSEAERAKRLAAPLTERQRAALDRFGYPYVGEDFTFHMTLSARLAGEEHDTVLAAAEARFADIARRPLAVRSLALYVEPRPGAELVLTRRFPLG